jgi:hypothetical protein
MFIDDCRMIMSSFIYDEVGMVRDVIAENHPYGLFVDDLCPHHIPWKEPTPREWLRENLTGYAIRWKDGIYFRNHEDAFAFKLRWM